jgi:hypothetical protein
MLICKTKLSSQLFALSTQRNYFLPRLSIRSITMSSSSFPPEELKAIVQEVATLLKERNETISVAETVTSTAVQQPNEY